MRNEFQTVGDVIGENDGICTVIDEIEHATSLNEDTVALQTGTVDLILDLLDGYRFLLHNLKLAGLN